MNCESAATFAFFAVKSDLGFVESSSLEIVQSEFCSLFTIL